MDCNLSETIKAEIIDLACQCNLNKVTLFGSRARGDNHERSDIDLFEMCFEQAWKAMKEIL